MTKTLTFQGVVDSKASKLRLMTIVFPYEEAVDLADRRVDDISPEFQIDIPVVR